MYLGNLSFAQKFLPITTLSKRQPKLLPEIIRSQTQTFQLSQTSHCQMILTEKNLFTSLNAVFFDNFVAIVLKTYNLGFLSVNLKKMINEKNILSHISEHTHGSMKAALYSCESKSAKCHPLHGYKTIKCLQLCISYLFYGKTSNIKSFF